MNLKTLELTGDLIGHSGAVQVRSSNCIRLSYLFTPSTDFCFKFPSFIFYFLPQIFLSFGESGLVTCSADHLLILWKNGERQSHLRSLALFQKLEENGGLWLDLLTLTRFADFTSPPHQGEKCDAASQSVGFWLLFAFLFNDCCLTFYLKPSLSLEVKYFMSKTKCLALPFFYPPSLHSIQNTAAQQRSWITEH